MSNDTNKPATGGDVAAEPITKEFFLSLSPASFEALPAAQRKAVVKWLLDTPHNLKGRPQSTIPSTKETK